MKAHAPTELIAEYATGALSPGMRLLVASHVAWCPNCRRKVTRLEAIGGALLAEGEEVAPEPRCLVRALARIAGPERRTRSAIPRSLARASTAASWLPGPPGSTRFTSGFVRMTRANASIITACFLCG